MMFELIVQCIREHFPIFEMADPMTSDGSGLFHVIRKITTPLGQASVSLSVGRWPDGMDTWYIMVHSESNRRDVWSQVLAPIGELSPHFLQPCVLFREGTVTLEQLKSLFEGLEHATAVRSTLLEGGHIPCISHSRRFPNPIKEGIAPSVDLDRKFPRKRAHGAATS